MINTKKGGPHAKRMRAALEPLLNKRLPSEPYDDLRHYRAFRVPTPAQKPS